MNSNQQPSFQIAANRDRFANRPVDTVLAGFLLAKEDAELLKNKFTRLTTREIEVLQRIAEGHANKQMAEALGIGIKTVEKHREHLMKKLNLHNTACLTRYAICVGILENTIQWTTA